MTTSSIEGAVAAAAAPSGALPDPPVRREAAWRRRDRRWGWLFVGPQLIGMGVFVVLPFFASLILAFASWNGLTALEWVGFDNFADQFQDELLWRSIANTLFIAVVTVPIGLGLAVVIAVALEKLKTRTLYLVLFFAPVMTSTVAVAMIWQQMFRADGVMSAAIAKVFGIAPPDWLGDPKLALIAVCIVTIWASLGLNVVIFLAGLQNISPGVIEAARIDGAGAWRIFWSIRLPLLSPILFFSSVVAFISSLQTFDTVYVLVQDAGPDDATRTIVYHIFDLGFRRFEFGPSSAASIILLVITLIITAIQFGAQKRFVHYEEDVA
ncbi:carbohydrate ABC transporter permease [Microbacterium hydrocarbonoxydans]|uniref:carbohydrate ABC transporter permease n=1 Tax=Microbacterium hydrocarbonoxydans TaxID=273678 RepID=UPI0007BB1B40|nr:sugar ABC transporter permease [Microbacterium hydrocarbonoxydans]GAT74502.1 ABC superfamily ATP binding cassette transporter, membrane protein [Microbacterium sp. HM58-2]